MRVLLVDDNQSFLAMTARFLQTIPRIQTTMTAQTGYEALAILSHKTVDLALLDIGLPDINGLDLARRVKAGPACPRVLVVTMHNTREYRAAAFAAGADGFISKADIGEQLAALIDSLFA